MNTYLELHKDSQLKKILFSLYWGHAAFLMGIIEWVSQENIILLKQRLLGHH